MNIQLNKIAPDRGTLKMPNNLDMLIRKAGMMRKEVAERKGIRPETVSRHISGALNFSIKDAEEYAIILGCTPQDVLFAQNAVPLFGYLDESRVTLVDPSDAEIAYHVPYPVDDYRRFVMATHTPKEKQWANGRLYNFCSRAVKAQKVDPNSIMQLCVFKIAKTKIIRFGVVYPEPGGTYAIGNSDSHNNTAQGVVPGFDNGEQNTGLTLAWCTPILSCVMQSELLGIVQKDQ